MIRGRTVFDLTIHFGVPYTVHPPHPLRITPHSAAQPREEDGPWSMGLEHRRTLTGVGVQGGGPWCVWGPMACVGAHGVCVGPIACVGGPWRVWGAGSCTCCAVIRVGGAGVVLRTRSALPVLTCPLCVFIPPSLESRTRRPHCEGCVRRWASRPPGPH